MRQSNNDTRELHGMVTHAFPGTDFEMQDQLAAKAFVWNCRFSMILIHVLNMASKTLNVAIKMVISTEQSDRNLVCSFCHDFIIILYINETIINWYIENNVQVNDNVYKSIIMFLSQC